MSKYLIEAGFCQPEERQYNQKGQITCLLIILTCIASSSLINASKTLLQFHYMEKKPSWSFKSNTVLTINYPIHSSQVSESHPSVTVDQADQSLSDSAYQDTKVGGVQEGSNLSLSVQGEKKKQTTIVMCTVSTLSSLQLRNCTYSF